MSLPFPRDKITSEMIVHLRNNGLNEIADECQAELDRSPTREWLNKFITSNAYTQMIRLKASTEKLAKVSDCVLIIGETGTGKELIARALHGDRPGAFIPVNCGGLPEMLMESELFGHKKGSFTGAVADRNGLIMDAQKGTLFLDEIGDLDLPLQVKLLRVIQERKIRQLGGNREIDIDCRFVCATHRNLDSYVKTGLFREDLYWRINTFTLTTMPLRTRSMDIPLIVKSLDTENKIKDIKEFCDRINPELLTGNVRSLQALVRRYYVLGEMP